MKITKEVNTAWEVRDNAWSGAIDTLNDMTDNEIETILAYLEDIYPDGMEEGELNDFLWFERDTIAEWLGWNEDEDEDEDDEEEEEEEDDA